MPGNANNRAHQQLLQQAVHSAVHAPRGVGFDFRSTSSHSFAGVPSLRLDQWRPKPSLSFRSVSLSSRSTAGASGLSPSDGRSGSGKCLCIRRRLNASGVGDERVGPCMRTDGRLMCGGMGVMLSYILPDHVPCYLLSRLPSPPTPCCVLPRSLAVSALFRHLAKFLESASSVRGAEGHYKRRVVSRLRGGCMTGPEEMRHSANGGGANVVVLGRRCGVPAVN